MQFQADVLGVEIAPPADPRDHGLRRARHSPASASASSRDLDEVCRAWQLERDFAPKMAEARGLRPRSVVARRGCEGLSVS